MSELEPELKGLQRGKCRDATGISVEMLKTDCRELRVAILLLFNAVLDCKATPTTWRCSTISVLL